MFIKKFTFILIIPTNLNK